MVGNYQDAPAGNVTGPGTELAELHKDRAAQRSGHLRSPSAAQKLTLQSVSSESINECSSEAVIRPPAPARASPEAWVHTAAALSGLRVRRVSGYTCTGHSCSFFIYAYTHTNQ